MKKVIFTSLLLSVFCLTSCSKEESEDKVDDTPDVVVSKLLKDWECTSISIEGTGNISGATVGSFQGVGYDHTDFEISFTENSSSIQKLGNYSLDLDIETTLIPETEFNIEDRVEFPIGTFSENSNNSITVTSSTSGVSNMTVLNVTETELSLLLNLEYEYVPETFTGVIKFPSQVTFNFKAKN